MTTVLDGAGEGSAKASWVLMRQSKKRTRLGPQGHGQSPRRFKQLHRVDERTGQVLVRTCSTERPHPAVRLALSVGPHSARRPGQPPAPFRLLGNAHEHARIGPGDQVVGAAIIRRGRSPADPIDPRAAARIGDHGSWTAPARAVPRRRRPKKPDRYWSALARTRACAKPSDFSRGSWLCQEI